MSKSICETVCLSMMAILDGEKPLLHPKQIRNHLKDCVSCRQESEDLENLALLFATYERRQPKDEVWAQIEPSLPASREAARPARAVSVGRAFGLLGAILLGVKYLEFLSSSDLYLWFKFAPILLVIVVFKYLNVNPFKVNTEFE